MKRERGTFTRRELLQAAAGLGLSGSTLMARQTAHAGENFPPDRTTQAAQKDRSAHAQPPVVLGYYPDWTKVDPTKLDFTLFTHLCHAFAYFDRNGVLRLPDETQTKALITAAHAKKVRVLLSVGGADSNAALREQKTDAFADILAQRIHDFHYDGVDVDWEAPENENDAAKLSALVQALRKRLPHALLTMAVSAEDYSGKWFHTEALLPATDWLNIMTYDFCGPWCDTVLHNAPLPQLKQSIDYWKGRGWPAQKLLLGIPNYGRRIRGTRFGDPAPSGTYYPDEIGYNDVQQFIKDGWKTMLDAEAQVPYLIKPEGGEIITYEDAVSARLKGSLARTAGLRGFFFWEVTLDFDGKTHTLGRAALQGWNAANS